ncbi:MAG TPA: hypothetical protein VL983_11900 [Terriglobales bacterium]|nr:hypothetical protein [Terriglobales bacterium]
MARGWESKSVEQQQEERVAGPKTSQLRLTPAQKETNRKREGLLLSRKRLVGQLQSSTHPAHRKMIEQSLAEIDRQLASFE